MGDAQVDGGLWYDYYDGFLKSIRDETRDFSAGIDPVFAASRGAALLSLESYLRPCDRKCDMVKCYERRPVGDENDWVWERDERERRYQFEVAELSKRGSLLGSNANAWLSRQTREDVSPSIQCHTTLRLGSNIDLSERNSRKHILHSAKCERRVTKERGKGPIKSKHKNVYAEYCSIAPVISLHEGEREKKIAVLPTLDATCL